MAAGHAAARSPSFTVSPKQYTPSAASFDAHVFLFVVAFLAGVPGVFVCATNGTIIHVYYGRTHALNGPVVCGMMTERR